MSEHLSKQKQQAHAQKHPFHLVDPSPWPLATTISVLLVGVGSVLSMHKIDYITLFLGLASLLFNLFMWWRDVAKESNEQGVHTKEVQTGLKIGMALFIASEVMLFVAFFWGYFHTALFPGEVIGNVWPPKGIKTLDPLGLPYFNTLLLLLSGSTLTWAHHSLVSGNRKDTLKGLSLTVFLGVLFLAIQVIEYAHAPFHFKDGIYPSLFYITTGFHGFHVLVGTIFLAVCLYRVHKNTITQNHYVGFETAAWYWHFVDVVWLFLFVSIYWW